MRLSKKLQAGSVQLLPMCRANCLNTSRDSPRQGLWRVWGYGWQAPQPSASVVAFTSNTDCIRQYILLLKPTLATPPPRASFLPSFRTAMDALVAKLCVALDSSPRMAFGAITGKERQRRMKQSCPGSCPGQPCCRMCPESSEHIRA